MRRIPRNITIGEMWETGPWYWRLWLFAPILCILTVFGSLFISLITNDAVWFVFGYPLAIVMMVGFKIWDKKVSV